MSEQYDKIREIMAQAYVDESPEVVEALKKLDNYKIIRGIGVPVLWEDFDMPEVERNRMRNNMDAVIAALERNGYKIIQS